MAKNRCFAGQGPGSSDFTLLQKINFTYPVDKLGMLEYFKQPAQF